MTTDLDLIQRLRAGAFGIDAPHDEACMQAMNDLALEAATAIERLQHELSNSEAHFDEMTRSCLAERDGRLKAERERDEVRLLLREHHDHHLTVGTIGLRDAHRAWVEIDGGAEYSESGLYERTDAALSEAPQEWKRSPRGGIVADWWQISVLERRKRRAAEKASERLYHRIAEMLKVLAPFAALADRYADDIRDDHPADAAVPRVRDLRWARTLFWEASK